MSAPRLIINGAKGRMGQALIAAAAELSLPVSAALDAGDNLATALANADVVVDFSSHSATAKVIEICVAQGKALVIGTTGHPATERQRLAAEAARIPSVWAGNFSIGVNLLFALTSRAATVLGDDYDAELIEMHHRHKKDAPSGTAARLLELILSARQLGPDALRHGRNGITGERTRKEVGVHALRGGGVVGDHTVIFASPGERLELTHKAGDRAIFAHGALRAAQWVVKQPSGLYDMQDVLGLKD